MAAGMPRHTSTSSVRGFTVYQASLGAPLQFLPPMGTKQLDELIDAYVPGPSPIQDKKTAITMDFCQYVRQTGETTKVYTVLASYSDSAATGSPASTAVYDSGYGSSFDCSPVISDLNCWTPAASASTTHSPASSSHTSSGSRGAGTSSSRSRANDFSHMPGMRIMTKDGQDVTNSASRGCKTKEQRDHAHLMRTMKACPSCKKRKVRCDPSHKRQEPTSHESKSTSRSAKKAKMRASIPQPASVAAPSFEPSFEPSFDPVSFGYDPLADASLLGDFPVLGESWEEFVQFDDATISAPVPDYDFLFGQDSFVSPVGSELSTPPAHPFTPASSGLSSAGVHDTAVSDPHDHAPALPYLTDGSHGSNYIDFNLYSPGSSFLDEEPQSIRKTNAFRSSGNDLLATGTAEVEQVFAPEPPATESASSELDSYYASLMPENSVGGVEASGVASAIRLRYRTKQSIPDASRLPDVSHAEGVLVNYGHLPVSHRTDMQHTTVNPAALVSLQGPVISSPYQSSIPIVSGDSQFRRSLRKTPGNAVISIGSSSSGALRAVQSVAAAASARSIEKVDIPAGSNVGTVQSPFSTPGLVRAQAVNNAVTTSSVSPSIETILQGSVHTSSAPEGAVHTRPRLATLPSTLVRANRAHSGQLTALEGGSSAGLLGGLSSGLDAAVSGSNSLLMSSHLLASDGGVLRTLLSWLAVLRLVALWMFATTSAASSPNLPLEWEIVAFVAAFAATAACRSCSTSMRYLGTTTKPWAAVVAHGSSGWSIGRSFQGLRDVVTYAIV